MTDGYRQNVGLIILRNSLIFAGFRNDVPENSPIGWQMPQGGIDENEDILTAGYREMFEETGITKENVRFIMQLPKTIKYDFTPKAIEHMKEKNKIRGYNGKLYKGQEQYWLVFEFLRQDKYINLKATDEPQEFSKFDWKTSDFLQKNVIDMKQKVYEEVFKLMKNNKINFK